LLTTIALFVRSTSIDRKCRERAITFRFRLCDKVELQCRSSKTSPARKACCNQPKFLRYAEMFKSVPSVHLHGWLSARNVFTLWGFSVLHW